MQSYRNNPDSPECQQASRDNERAVFAAQMQAWQAKEDKREAREEELLNALAWLHRCAFSFVYADNEDARNYYLKDVMHALDRAKETIEKTITDTF